MKAAIIVLYVLFSGLAIWTFIQQMQINSNSKRLPKSMNGNGKPATDTLEEEGDPNRIVYGEEVYDKVMNGASVQRKIEINL